MLVSAPASVPGVTGPSRPVSPYSIASFAEQQEVLFDRQRGLEQQRRDITHAALELARERQLFQEEREMFFKESLSAETERTLCVLDKVMGELELD
ncbi:hypothetical protein BC829DRAFT_408070 [Chytridium lagenaria]|nr:hypothetical protein BC829DRAFT_408070 [Chytridium lagenaria]